MKKYMVLSLIFAILQGCNQTPPGSMSHDGEASPNRAYVQAAINACIKWSEGEREFPDFAGKEPEGCDKWLNK